MHVSMEHSHCSYNGDVVVYETENQAMLDMKIPLGGLVTPLPHPYFGSLPVNGVFEFGQVSE